MTMYSVKCLGCEYHTICILYEEASKWNHILRISGGCSFDNAERFIFDDILGKMCKYYKDRGKGVLAELDHILRH